MPFQINHTQSRKATQAELNCDIDYPLIQRVNDFQVATHEYLRIQVICSHIEGGGDIQFALKFVNQLLAMLDGTDDFRIDFCVSDLKVKDKDGDRIRATAGIRSQVKIRTQYDNDGTTHQFNPHARVDLYVMHEDGGVDYWWGPNNQGPATLTPVPTPQIVFIAPATNRYGWRINYSNDVTPANIYVLSELNPSRRYHQEQAGDPSDISIASGIWDVYECYKDPTLCPTGVFMPPIRNYSRPAGVTDGNYAVTYFYAQDEQLKDMWNSAYDEYAEPEIEAYLYNNEPYHGGDPVAPEIGAYVDEECDPVPGAWWYRSMMSLSSCLVQFLRDLDAWHSVNGQHQKITVYHPPSFDLVGRFSRFAQFQKGSSPLFDILLYYLTHAKSPFVFVKQPHLTNQEMLELFANSLPYALLSGDNTPIEFITTNHAEVLNLYYMSFYWKRAIAEALGINVESRSNYYTTCGKIAISRMAFLRNAAQNFSLAGVQQVNALLQLAMTQAMGQPPPNCENADHSLITQRLYGPHNAPTVEGEASGFVYTIRHNPEHDIVSFSSVDSAFNSALLKGDFEAVLGGGGLGETATGGFVAGFPYSSVFIKFIPNVYLTMKEQGLVSAGRAMAIKDCANLWWELPRGRGQAGQAWNNPHLVDSTGPTPVVSTPAPVATLMVANLLNGVIEVEGKSAEYDPSGGAASFLVRTLATLASHSTDAAETELPCSSRLRERFQNGSGVFVVQEFVPDANRLRRYVQCRLLPSRDLCRIFCCLTIALSTLQDRLQFVHNDLYGSNVMIRELPETVHQWGEAFDEQLQFETKLYPVIVDVDNAGFDFNGTRYVSQEAYAHTSGKTRHFYNWFDFAYFIGDILDIYESNGWYSEQECGRALGQHDLLNTCYDILHHLFPDIPTENLDKSVYQRNAQMKRVPYNQGQEAYNLSQQANPRNMTRRVVQLAKQ
jgi:hypothetical protein